MRIHKYILLCGLLPGLMSCNKQKLQAPEAAFIKIDTADVLITQPGTEGSRSSNITDIWVYVDDKFKGAFPVGQLIPIASQGSANILIFPGIKNNGISATRMPYYFLQGINVNLDLKTMQTVSLHPKFPYKTGAVFHQIESCEPAGWSFENDPESAMSYSIVTGSSNPNVYEGQGSLYMTMTDAQNLCKVRSSTAYVLPTAGATVYMELDYKCNQQFEVGVTNSSGGDRTALTLNPSGGEWKKVYVRLTDVVSTQPTYTDYRMYIKAVKQIDSPEIYIDNIKLISD